MKISKEFLDSTVSFVQDIAFDAGEIILKYQSKRQQLLIRNKGSDGIASEADEKSEEFILSEIKSRFPDHSILSEEDYSKGIVDIERIKNTKDFLWVIDPLDGTNNFVNGIPIYCVSIALMFKGESIVGVVYNPFSGECFYSTKGHGSFLVDFRINPLKKFSLKRNENNKEMSDCIFSPAPVYGNGIRFETQLSTFKKNIVGARAVRRLGSAALELCYVANGNFDSYWEEGLKPWDVAAAILILREAGSQVTDFNGLEFNPFMDSIIASYEPLHSRILGKIST